MPAVLHDESELLHLLYQGLTASDGFHGFLEALSGAINGCAAQLAVMGKTPLRLDHLWYHGLSDEFLQWYQDNNMINQDVVTQTAIGQSPGLFQSALPLLPDFEPGTDCSEMSRTCWILPGW